MNKFDNISQLRKDHGRAIEIDKFRVRDKYETISEWNKFRDNEEKFISTVTTWKLKVYYVSYDNDYYCIIPTYPDYKVLVKKSYKMGGVMWSGSMSVHQNDFLTVTGEFSYCSKDGEIVLYASWIKNEGRNSL